MHIQIQIQTFSCPILLTFRQYCHFLTNLARMHRKVTSRQAWRPMRRRAGAKASNSSKSDSENEHAPPAAWAHYFQREAKGIRQLLVQFGLDLVQFGLDMIWFSLVWIKFGLVWFGLDLVQFGLDQIWFSLVWIRFGLLWFGLKVSFFLNIYLSLA